jgi:RluA family pseudouridine synthase
MVAESPEIIFRDARLAVLNKPADLSLLADRSGQACLWDQLPDILGGKPYLVHRLDKPTSGALAIALDVATQRALTRAFQARQVGKYYLAWVLGDPGSRGTIDLPLRKGRKSRYRVAGPRDSINRSGDLWSIDKRDDEGKESLTRYRRLRRTDGRSLLLLSPRTGRTHQLRVHLSWIGHPIVGDRLYGRPDDPAQQGDRLYLHSHRIVLPDHGSFAAPTGGDWIRVSDRSSDRAHNRRRPPPDAG